jgi:adenine phosphoribosyltransferase
MDRMEAAIRAKIRDVPDFPKKGIVFKDITPVLSDRHLFKQVIDALATRWRGEAIQKVVGKLPWQAIREIYALEYGEDSLEMHIDAVGPGERVLVVDDLLATGGTAEAVGRLVRRQGADLAGYSFVVELGALNGARRLGAGKVHTLVRY